MTMRSWPGELTYQKAIEQKKLTKISQETPIRDYKHWRIVKNGFPHDKIAQENHMLVLKREATLITIKLTEVIEFFKIIGEISQDYDVVLYNLPNMSSVKDIPHCHLYRLLPEFK